MSRDGEQWVFVGEDSKMKFRNRKLLQTLTVAVLLAYTILLVYQSFATGVINHEVNINELNIFEHVNPSYLDII